MLPLPMPRAASRHGRIVAARAPYTGARGGVSFSPLELPGPTGESNRLSFAPRGAVVCLGPGAEAVQVQVAMARAAGNAVVAVAAGASAALTDHAADPHVVILDGQIAPDPRSPRWAVSPPSPVVRTGTCSAATRAALARRSGPILPLIAERDGPERYVLERHLCVDTTAAGGNASLLAQAGS